MKFNRLLSIFILSLILIACNNNSQKSTNEPTAKSEMIFQNKAHKLVYQMVQKIGTYADLANKNDVVYTYTYKTPDGKTDISTEKYLFDGELSMATYQTHQRTLPALKGTITQGYNGNEFWLKNNGSIVTDKEALKKVKFNRKTNFYWFAMFQKLLDPGVKYQHVGESSVNDKMYDIVKITFESEDNKPTDTYQLHINQTTGLVDRFLFTVVDFGVVDNPMLMELEYKKTDGITIPSKRRYKKSNWNADVFDTPWIEVNWSNIKFNTGLKKADFDK